jgi:thioredoxin-related protein
MKKILLGLLVLFSLAVKAQDKEQTGQKQLNLFADAKEKAKAENKNILLYFSGSDWCAPCIKFKKNFINNEDFKTVSDAKLIIYNADFPRLKAHKLAKEKTTDNGKLADIYNKSGYFPMILLLDANGKIVKKWEGYPPETPQEFIKIIQ